MVHDISTKALCAIAFIVIGISVAALAGGHMFFTDDGAHESQLVILDDDAIGAASNSDADGSSGSPITKVIGLAVVVLSIAMVAAHLRNANR